MIADAHNSKEIVDNFKQLWQACYFERHLTKQKVEQIDLDQIVKELISYFSELDDPQKFRKVAPLL